MLSKHRAFTCFHSFTSLLLGFDCCIVSSKKLCGKINAVLKILICCTGSYHILFGSNFLGYAFSEDGEYFAYGLSSSGSDWVTIKFMKVEGPEELPDTLERVKFSCMAWTHDGKGMFYNCYPKQDGKSDGKYDCTDYTL